MRTRTVLLVLLLGMTAGSSVQAQKKYKAYVVSNVFTYIYKFGIELPESARMLVLPKDESVAVFAVTLSDNYIDDIRAANEMRTLPLCTKK